MRIDGNTIYFKSVPENFELEKTEKCFTIRELSGQELKSFKEAELSRIVITNTETGESFERSIAGVLSWRKATGTRPNKTLYKYEDLAIWWAPQKRRGRPKMKGEDAVSEKRM